MEDLLEFFFAFDPKRQGILLVGGNKKGEKNFYKRLISKADQLFSEYLENSYECAKQSTNQPVGENPT